MWAAAGAVSGTPGEVYLGARLGGGWPGEHVSVRWIGSAEYSGLDVGGWPGLPAGAAGALVYLFASPADCGAAHAVQVEAVDVAGGRLLSWRHWDRAAGVELVREAKRETVAGSRFGHGRRVFVGRLAAGPCWLVEGPIDALAVARNLPAGLAGAILGAAGVPGFQVGAVEAIPAGTAVVIAADGDPEGRTAARRMGTALERAGRRWSIQSPGAGDWCDWYAARAVDRAERAAIGGGRSENDRGSLRFRGMPQGRPWTRQEDWAIRDAARLTRQFGLTAPFQGYHARLRQVSEQMGRSYAAVRKRAARMKIRSYKNVRRTKM